MTDLGRAQYFLGTLITRNREEKTIALSQQPYLERSLKRLGLEDLKSQRTPMGASETPLPTEDNETCCDKEDMKFYQQT